MGTGGDSLPQVEKKIGFNRIVALKLLHAPESPGGLLKHKSLNLTSEPLILVGLGLENLSFLRSSQVIPMPLVQEPNLGSFCNR